MAFLLSYARVHWPQCSIKRSAGGSLTRVRRFNDRHRADLTLLFVIRMRRTSLMRLPARTLSVLGVLLLSRRACQRRSMESVLIL
jgi:hypothetical protein